MTVFVFLANLCIIDLRCVCVGECVRARVRVHVYMSVRPRAVCSLSVRMYIHVHCKMFVKFVA